MNDGNLVQFKGAVHDEDIAEGVPDVSSNVTMNDGLYSCDLLVEPDWP